MFERAEEGLGPVVLTLRAVFTEGWFIQLLLLEGPCCDPYERVRTGRLVYLCFSLTLALACYGCYGQRTLSLISPSGTFRSDKPRDDH